MISSSASVRLNRIILRCPFDRRFFFASSTDHTTLLANAEVHCLHKEGGKKQFVLAASGTERDIVQKVPQLHLARIELDGNKVYGAKVVNRTLGEIPKVCETLLEAAVSEGGTEALATLHGLSNWITSDDEIINRICSGDMGCYDEGKEKWETFARQFVDEGVGEEAALYQSRGGELARIEHRADCSEFANTCGEAMAIFRL